MSVPVTARLEEAVVDALDRAVAAGLAPSRGSLVAALASFSVAACLANAER